MNCAALAMLALAYFLFGGLVCKPVGTTECDVVCNWIALANGCTYCCVTLVPTSCKSHDQFWMHACGVWGGVPGRAGAT
jgi:hypothetical protein